MATERSASLVLLSLVIAIVLSVALFAVSSSSLLSKYAYKMKNDAAWSFPTGDDSVCEKPQLPNKGFPLMDRQPDYSNAACYGTNYLAEAINAALCFTLAAIIAVPTAMFLKERYE